MDQSSETEAPETIQWQGDAAGHLVLLDQTKLPAEIAMLECRTVEQVWEAIRQLSVRGAPAIGIAAAYGVCVGLQTATEENWNLKRSRVNEVCDYLATSRPTAVNLFWALDRMRAAAEKQEQALIQSLLQEAKNIHREDRQQCEAIGQHGLQLLCDSPPGSGMLTHCNTGALATGGAGTALAVIFAMAEAGKQPRVFVDETRPLLQGARLTAWELQQRGLDATLICDSMAAQVMKEGRIQAVITGADRIAANGDSANKIGTYSIAVLAKAHSIPFYIAAPSTTFDLSLASGDEIPIEERPAEEITCGFGTPTAPKDIAVYNPAFDVTPAKLISAIITERGVIKPVTKENVMANLS